MKTCGRTIPTSYGIGRSGCATEEDVEMDSTAETGVLSGRWCDECEGGNQEFTDGSQRLKVKKTNGNTFQDLHH